MNIIRRNKAKQRRSDRTRHNLQQTGQCMRLSVHRSNRVISAQVIDDSKGHTLASATSQKYTQGAGLDQAKEVGLAIAKAAIAAGVSSVVFDRGSYLYHGRVKALADGARQGGLQF